MFTPVYKRWVYDGLASLDRQSAATWLGPETVYGFRAHRLQLREIPCQIQRLDDDDLDPVFIKIDVQGLECEVVRGGWGTIRRFEPLLMIEDLSRRQELGALLAGAGYRQYRFDATGFYRAADPGAMNFLMMTAARAASLHSPQPAVRV